MCSTLKQIFFWNQIQWYISFTFLNPYPYDDSHCQFCFPAFQNDPALTDFLKSQNFTGKIWKGDVVKISSPVFMIILKHPQTWYVTICLLISIPIVCYGLSWWRFVMVKASLCIACIFAFSTSWIFWAKQYCCFELSSSQGAHNMKKWHSFLSKQESLYNEKKMFF